MSMVGHEIQEVKLQRALIIGLGGSGAEVIRRLRRLLIDRFGRFENIPIVRFLYIDTDPNWLWNMASEIEEDIRLPEAERFDAQFPDATPLYEGIQRGEYPHYAWFSIERLKHHTSVTNGAGTIRQLGRLCFWHHFTDIRDKMSVLMRSLNADQNARFMQETYGIVVDPGMNVHIVAGLAGGTGSGMFLDVAYLARHLLDVLNIQGAHQIIGYLILPDAFVDLLGANALPNGYAALKELNYYSYKYDPKNQLATVFGQPLWEADYTGQGTDRVEFINQAPFDYCYLLSSSNPNVQLRRDDIFAMVARSLFHDFTSEFSAFKRSLRANIKKQIVSNDIRDCPQEFMSFGQSSVLLPRNEVEQVLKHQMALRAVQRWIDKRAKPIEVFVGTEEITDVDQAVNSAIASMRQQAQESGMISAVQHFLISELEPSVGLNARDVLVAIVAEERERLVDVPYSLREAEKQRWVAEHWPFDKFIGEVTDAWRRWRSDFNDEGPNPMQWGQQIRKLVANKGRAEKGYRRRLYAKVVEMFEDTDKYGPAWALCVVQQLCERLQKLKQDFIKEANDPVAIARLLGDVYLINQAAGGQGPSLSALIEARIGQELNELDNAVRSPWPFGKRERVEAQAYEYLTWCAHWCRARVEERARRIAAELMDSLDSALRDMEREMLEHARVLARLQAELLKRAREWSQKAISTENIGKLLYDPNIMRALETKVAELQGDKYDPDMVAQKALEKLKKKLWEVREDEVQQLIDALMAAAKEAVGDLEEEKIQETRFAAYDLLSALTSDDKTLDQVLTRTIESGAPFVRLNPNPPGGPWGPLLMIRGAGLRGGYNPNDQDRERVRIIESLRRVGWNPDNDIKPINDSSQIVFFQECGGFPLRALQGIQEMKRAYEEHQKRGGPPLHIVRDELAERYPDIIPPGQNELNRALTIQSVAIPLGFITLERFPHPDGTGRTLELYAYKRELKNLGEFEPIPLGPTPESIGIKLAYDPKLLEEIEQTIEETMQSATPEQKTEYAIKLRKYLDEFKERLRTYAGGADPTTMPAYTQERNRIQQFMQRYGLSIGESTKSGSHGD